MFNVCMTPTIALRSDWRDGVGKRWFDSSRAPRQFYSRYPCPRQFFHAQFPSAQRQRIACAGKTAQPLSHET